jgi:hypothetical protein
MNVLQSYVRRILTEAAKGPNDLPDEVHVKIVEANDFIRAYYCDEDGQRFNRGDDINGFVAAKLTPTEIAEEMKAYSVVLARVSTGFKTSHGWGPMLYDVVMERLGMKGYGLAPDRNSVSADAINVWDFYMNQRDDIEKKQLDFRPDYDRHETKTPNDDADMQTNWWGLMSNEPGKRKAEQEKYLKSSRSKAYYASGTPTIGALSVAGKLITNSNSKDPWEDL